jgi:hypothetical protein
MNNFASGFDQTYPKQGKAIDGENPFLLLPSYHKSVSGTINGTITSNVSRRVYSGFDQTYPKQGKAIDGENPFLLLPSYHKSVSGTINGPINSNVSRRVY